MFFSLFFVFLVTSCVFLVFEFQFVLLFFPYSLKTSNRSHVNPRQPCLPLFYPSGVASGDSLIYFSDEPFVAFRGLKAFSPSS